MAPVPKELFYGQKIDKEGVFQVDFRHPDGSIVHFSERLDDIIGVTDRKATNGQTGFFSSKLTNDIRLDAKEPWKIHYKACSAEGKNDWTNDTYDLLQIIDFNNNMIAFKKQTVLVETHSASMTKQVQQAAKKEEIVEKTKVVEVASKETSASKQASVKEVAVKETSSIKDATTTKEVATKETVAVKESSVTKESAAIKEYSSITIASKGTTATGAKQTTVASAQQTTIAGVQQGVVAGGQQTTVASAQSSSFSSSQQSSVSSSHQSSFSSSQQSTVASSQQSTISIQQTKQQTAVAKASISTKKDELASQNKIVADLKAKVAVMEAYIEKDSFKDGKDRAKYQRDLDTKTLELTTAKHELGSIKTEVEKLREHLKAEEADDLMMEALHELQVAEMNLQLESAQSEIQKLKTTVHNLEGFIAVDHIHDAQVEEAHKREMLELKRKSELEVGFAKTKAEMEEAKELAMAHERLQMEERLRITEQRIADQDRTISSRLMNVGRTYGDYAHLNTEIKERDLQMALMFQDQSDMYRELSVAHERFSTVDMERLAMKEEQKRVTSGYAGLKYDLVDTSMKFKRLEADYRRQEAFLKQTIEEKTFIETKCSTLENETDQLRRELLALKLQNADLKAERRNIHAQFEKAKTTITGHEVIIKHSESWKALYEQQVQTLRKELMEITAVMARLEQSYQDTAKAFRMAQTEKQRLQSELTEIKYSKTAVEARVIVVEQALQSTRAELSQLSKSYEQKDDELRAMAGIRAVLERRLSELNLSHTRERNVTRNISERLVHVQGNLAENVDWMYDMRHDLGEESKYLYLHYLHHGGEVGLGLNTPPLSRLPSYGSATNSPSGSPAKETASIVEAASSATDVKTAHGNASATYASVASHGTVASEKASISAQSHSSYNTSLNEKASFSQSMSAQTTSMSQAGSVTNGFHANAGTAIVA